ncbi:hypothetical protein PanWU01x14_083040 [Parasponia andersonii]|uniref:Uncharacterized protein n=1 Tax=Parasponia andersonii TaxID=3476 RepID=A0A2P5DA16_PARAD|nr:hypothetical protein PanWU01x14_083040 [Parasponia andersonii]
MNASMSCTINKENKHKWAIIIPTVEYWVRVNGVSPVVLADPSLGLLPTSYNPGELRGVRVFAAFYFFSSDLKISFLRAIHYIFMSILEKEILYIPQLPLRT